MPEFSDQLSMAKISIIDYRNHFKKMNYFVRFALMTCIDNKDKIFSTEDTRRFQNFGICFMHLD